MNKSWKYEWCTKHASPTQNKEQKTQKEKPLINILEIKCQYVTSQERVGAVMQQVEYKWDHPKNKKIEREYIEQNWKHLKSLRNISKNQNQKGIKTHLNETSRKFNLISFVLWTSLNL